VEDPTYHVCVKNLDRVWVEGICEAVEENREQEGTKGGPYLVRVDGLV
jgi:hypothetical protein